MSNTSWGYVPTPHFDPTPLRLLAPIRAADPARSRDLPSPPYPPTAPPLNIPYVLTTHVIPSALPRFSPNVPVPSVPQASTKEERREANAKTYEGVSQLWRKLIKGELGTEGSEKHMVNVVNRYVHRELLGDSSPKRQGVTLMFAHANGFPKEIWEPAINRLLASPGTAATVDEVWVWEAVQHGDSYLLNADVLDGAFFWHDNARDIANFLLHYLPTTPTGVLPTHLTPVSPAESQRRRIHGFTDRTLAAIGHSYGGCSSAFAALTFPALFNSIIFVDPVIVMPGRYKEKDDKHANNLVKGAVTRREEWASREAALASFQESPFFQAWHPSVLQKYCERGIHYPADLLDPAKKHSGPAKLKMPGVQEAVVFVDTVTATEVFQLLPLLDKRIELRWVMPGKVDGAEIGGPGHGHILCWRRPENSSNIRIAKAGHLIAQQAPHELADDITAFLERKYSAAEATKRSKL